MYNLKKVYATQYKCINFLETIIRNTDGMLSKTNDYDRYVGKKYSKESYHTDVSTYKLQVNIYAHE